MRLVTRTGAILFVAAMTWAPPSAADWTGKGEAGLVIATGNSETETANAKAKFSNEIGKWKHTFGGSALYATDEGDKSAQRWEVSEQSDYNFSSRTFWFGALRYEQDEFSGFEYQGIVSTGLGRRFIDTDVTKFVGTAGVGYKTFETRDTFDDLTGVLIAQGERDSDITFRGTLDFEHSFTETTKIIDAFIVEYGSTNTYVQNDLSLQVRMTDVLALAVGYSVRHNTDPPIGFEKTDTLTTINLVAEIK
jgi:putative salt-induced outer membrane protein